MTDSQLACLGYITVLWNGLERQLCTAIWNVAGWTQKQGELVTANLANPVRLVLLSNLFEQEGVDDNKMLTQFKCSIKLFRYLEIERNRLAHGSLDFNNFKMRMNFRYNRFEIDGLKHVSEKSISAGHALRRVVIVETEHLNSIAEDIYLCSESWNDLYHKLHFRRLFISGERGPFAQNYEDAVHGWRAPAFDVGKVEARMLAREAISNPLVTGKKDASKKRGAKPTG